MAEDKSQLGKEASALSQEKSRLGAEAGAMNPGKSADVADQGYWERVASLGFALPKCAACGRFHFYPKPACPFCGSEQVHAQRASGQGSLYSYSVVHRAPSPAFASRVPYVVAIVATDEGPHLMTHLVGVDQSDIKIGMRVRVRADSPGLAPVFERAGSASGVEQPDPASGAERAGLASGAGRTVSGELT